MTLPDERYIAILRAEKFLRELVSNRKEYPRVPLRVREEAKSILRHFPEKYHLTELSRVAPDIIKDKRWFLTETYNSSGDGDEQKR